MARSRLSVVVHLGLGSNQGDRVALLGSAVTALAAAGLEMLAASAVYESDYVGPGTPQPPFLNAVVAARTDLSPLVLLGLLQRIEAAHGRRPGTHGRPRRLDLDLLLYGGWTIRHPDLVVPHPRLADRRFVLEPLNDLGALRGRPDLERRLAALRPGQSLRPVPGVALGGERGAAVVS